MKGGWVSVCEGKMLFGTGIGRPYNTQIVWIFGQEVVKGWTGVKIGGKRGSDKGEG